MASVKLNETIRAHIKSKLSGLFDTRAQAVEAEWKKIDVQQLVYKYATANAHEANVIRSIPAKWLTKCDVVNLHITGMPNDKTQGFRVVLGPQVIAPIDATTHYPICTIQIPYGSPEANLCFELNAKSVAIKEERNALLNGPIMKAVGECTTLKQLLEVWPTALDFVDAPTRAKHAEKHVSAERKAKAQREVLAIPTDVQVQLITARMTSQ